MREHPAIPRSTQELEELIRTYSIESQKREALLAAFNNPISRARVKTEMEAVQRLISENSDTTRAKAHAIVADLLDYAFQFA
jgi:hypothetical protein